MIDNDVDVRIVKGSRIYYVLCIDMNWFKKDRDVVLDGVRQPTDLSIHEPTIVDECLTMDDAKKRADELNDSLKDDEMVEFELQNSQHYKGKRHYYSYYSGV